MTLLSRLTARISSDRADQLSNPDLPGASSSDTTRLQAAADDAQGIFETVTGVTYDDTNARHVAYAVAGAEIILRVRAQGLNSIFNDPDMKGWKVELREIAGTLGRATFAPKATSGYTPSEPETGRPPFDQRNFDDIRIRPPRQNNRGLPGDNN